MKFQLGAMTIGDILDRGLKMLLAHLPAFYILHLLVLWPVIICQLGLPSLFPPDSFAPLMISSFIPLLAAIILQPIATAAMVHIISQDFIGEPVSLGSALRFAVRRFVALLGTSILTGLAIMAGLCLFFLPAVWFVFYAQVVVVEYLGGTRALSRSMALTKGYRWHIFAVLILMLVIVYAIQIPPSIIMGQLIPAYDQVPVPKKDKLNPFELGFRLVPIYPNIWINVIVSWLVSIVAQAYAAICVTLLYFDLRNRKEGFDLLLAAREPLNVEPLEP